MKISQLNGQRAKIGKNSITVKDETGKTCGVITQAQELQNRDMSAIWTTYREAVGLAATECIRKTRRIDGAPVFLANIRSDKERTQAEALTAAGIATAYYIPA